MIIDQYPQGWQFYHHERLFVRANTCAPIVRLKFFHYPSYRQSVKIIQSPVDCTLKTKGNNMFFLFHQKVRTKYAISLERTIEIFPIPSSVTKNKDWGEISNIKTEIKQKYKQSSYYWPVQSSQLQNISKENWFADDSLFEWVKGIGYYLIKTIKNPEKQEKRLGAEQAFLAGAGDCDEFIDLFITLARIRGIPCRRLTGYFIRNEKAEPEPHAWGEIQSPTLGWIPIDIALHNIGNHTINYVILKIEEFNPALPDYSIIKPSASVQYNWERPVPLITPIY
ncbi:MAG: hypothetical protein BV456_08605 [Thermoplasmata archaeon M8B2D]|nr:MAG: hypothetical protein BV456_08605 [Thermoplasmata archaeon M8B2D]